MSARTDRRPDISPARPRLQARLAVGRADDPAEREADAIADSVIAGLARRQFDSAARPPEAAVSGVPARTRIRRSSLADSVGRSVDPAVIRRDIGFEFESQHMMTKRTNLGVALPAGPFVDANTANATFNAPTATRVDKGVALLAQPNQEVEVQADDGMVGSDLEVVTTHFPESPAGRGRLDNAMTSIDQLILAFMAVQRGTVASAESLDGTAGFSSTLDDGMILGNWNTAPTMPQVTMGIRLGNVGDIVKDLHDDQGENALEKADRDPGRLRMRRPDPNNANQPIAPTEDAQILIDGHGLATQAIADWQNVDNAAPGGRELEGFLTIIFTYCEGVQHKTSFLKQHTPLMAKTSLATIWTTLPGPVQTYYGTTTKSGKTNLERLVETSPGYAAKMKRPFFDLDPHAAMQEKIGNAPKQWYHKLTIKSWLRGIALRDNGTVEGMKQFFFGPKGSTTRRGVDQLTETDFPDRPGNRHIEGYGVKDNMMDTDPTTNDDLPIFEIRSASRPITFNAAHQWALDVFDYIVDLNANPNGGHQRMV